MIVSIRKARRARGSPYVLDEAGRTALSLGAMRSIASSARSGSARIADSTGVEGGETRGAGIGRRNCFWRTVRRAPLPPHHPA